jgi:hypothetical protein
VSTLKSVNGVHMPMRALFFLLAFRQAGGVLATNSGAVDDRLRECITVDALRGSGMRTWFRASSMGTNQSSSTS